MKESGQIRPTIGRIPFLWRKRIANLISQDTEQAIEFFFTKYLQEKDSKQMKYGLENTLPLSLKYIVSRTEFLDKNDFERTLDEDFDSDGSRIFAISSHSFPISEPTHSGFCFGEALR